MNSPQRSTLRFIQVEEPHKQKFSPTNGGISPYRMPNDNQSYDIIPTLDKNQQVKIDE